jgi:hypothetical protein|tara:strand:+ start:3133 stop:3366 length:234 start_codon:yes stop_codon:yes gene_type:complete
MDNTTYVIIDATDVEEVDFSEVLETSEDTVRWSIDQTKTVVKFVGETPSFLDGKTQYNHSEILAILATPEWTHNDAP